MKKSIGSLLRFYVSVLRGLFSPRVFVPLLLLGAVYLLQQHYPQIHRYGALWKHPRIEMHPWQFFTCTFLSGNAVHLLVNSLGLAFVFTQLAPQVRLIRLLSGFILLSAGSAALYYEFAMPGRAWLVGASGGIYGLAGFFAWTDRNARFLLLNIKRCPVPPGLLFGLMLGLEALIGWRWLPALAWPLHWIGFGCGFGAGLLREGVRRWCGAWNGLTVSVSESEVSL